MQNFISILITNFNKEKFLERSLNSVSKQNYKNYEIIIYDDSSTDNSVEIIKKFKNIKLIKNDKRNKKSGPINQIKGILECYKVSKGKIICLMDADDYFVDNKLLMINKFFNQNKGYNCLFNFPKSNRKQFIFKEKKQLYKWPTIFPTSCISFRKKFFIKFIKFLKPNNFPNLEIDARLTIFSNSYFNEYNILKKYLTRYNYDQYGITAKIDKFSKNWWRRRRQAYSYLEFILKEKGISKTKSFDYYITSFINLIIN